MGFKAELVLFVLVLLNPIYYNSSSTAERFATLNAGSLVLPVWALGVGVGVSWMFVLFVGNMTLIWADVGRWLGLG